MDWLTIAKQLAEPTHNARRVVQRWEVARSTVRNPLQEGHMIMDNIRRGAPCVAPSLTLRIVQIRHGYTPSIV
jgi:hypothetical protein